MIKLSLVVLSTIFLSSCATQCCVSSNTEELQDLENMQRTQISGTLQIHQTIK